MHQADPSALHELGEQHAQQLDRLIDDYDAALEAVYERADNHAAHDRNLAHLESDLASLVLGACLASSTMGTQHLHDELQFSIGATAGFVALDMPRSPKPGDFRQYVADAVKLAVAARAGGATVLSTLYRGKTIVESESVRTYDEARRTAQGTLSRMPPERAMELGFQAARSQSDFNATTPSAGMIPILGQQWSAVNDRATCERCRSLDGQIVSLSSDFGGERPPLHARCRCTTCLAIVGWVMGSKEARSMNDTTKKRPIPTLHLGLALDVRDANVDQYERVIRDATASDDSLDSHGTCIKSWDLTRFNANPVLKWGHHRYGVQAQPDDMLGNADVRQDGNRLAADLRFSPKGLNPKADLVFDQMRTKVVRGLSVEFRPLEYHYENENTATERVIIDRAELAALSVVPVPSNPNALTRALLEGESDGGELKSGKDAASREPAERSVDGAASPAKEMTMDENAKKNGLPASIAASLGVDTEEAAVRAISELQLKLDKGTKLCAELEARAVKAESDLKARIETEVTAEVSALIKAERIGEGMRAAAMVLARADIEAFRQMYPAATQTTAAASADAPKAAALQEHLTRQNPAVRAAEASQPRRPIAEMEREMKSKIAEFQKAGDNLETATCRALEFFQNQPAVGGVK